VPLTISTTRGLAAATVSAVAHYQTCNLAAAADFKQLDWQQIENTCPGGIQSGLQADCLFTDRLKVPGGWLVRSTRFARDPASHYVAPGYPGAQSGSYTTGGGVGVGVGLTFLSDPNHIWQP